MTTKTRVYIFQQGTTGVFAYSVDKTGANIPTLDPQERWLLRGTIDDLSGIPANHFEEVEAALDLCGFHFFNPDGE